MDTTAFIPGLVSVIIPTYNRFELLNHSIKSVLNNTYKNVEIIVINDCSTDKRYYDGELEKYEKTTVIHLPVNMKIKHNVSSAQGITRNYGLEKARGEWIAFLDDDDFYHERKIETQLSAMKSANMLFSSTNMFIINHKSIRLDTLEYEVTCINGEQKNQIFNLDIIRKANHISNSSVIIHHTIVKKTGELHIVPREEDWDYWKRALMHTDCLYLGEPLVYFTMTVRGHHKIRYYY